MLEHLDTLLGEGVTEATHRLYPGAVVGISEPLEQMTRYRHRFSRRSRIARPPLDGSCMESEAGGCIHRFLVVLATNNRAGFWQDHSAARRCCWMVRIVSWLTPNSAARERRLLLRLNARIASSWSGVSSRARTEYRVPEPQPRRWWGGRRSETTTRRGVKSSSTRNRSPSNPRSQS